MAEKLDIHNEEQLSKITDLNNCDTEWLANAQTVAIYLGKDWGPEYCKLERAYIAGRYENANIWHDLRKNPDDLPKDNNKLYLVYVYIWNGNYRKYGDYLPTVCEWNTEWNRFESVDDGVHNSRNIRNCIKWAEL